jgi:hypothetical protein
MKFHKATPMIAKDLFAHDNLAYHPFTGNLVPDYIPETVRTAKLHIQRGELFLHLNNELVFQILQTPTSA